MTNNTLYSDIAARTGGDIYIGVVGPVRTGKSTFIKRFMETLVIPNIDDVYMQERARDELPQSGSGRTIMTAEPKFVPEDAVEVSLDDAARCSVRLIDCVGYMVPGAVGHIEDGAERMVTTPWFDHEIPITQAAETGTRKVITDHSTIGILITTDGSITDIPRSDYISAEERVVSELQAIGKPFLLLINSADPEGGGAAALRSELSEKYGVTCVVKNCLTLTESDVREIIGAVLCEFPVSELGIYLPSWVDALPADSTLRTSLYSAMRGAASGVFRMKDVSGALDILASSDVISDTELDSMDLGSGRVTAVLDVPRELFYSTISEQSGLDIRDDGDLISVLCEIASIKAKYDKIAPAYDEAMASGYGVVFPDQDDMQLEEPEIVRRSGHYAVRLKASAPSIHMLKADIETEVSPAVGGESSSEDIISFLLQEFEGDANRLWESNLFGKSLYDIAGEGLLAKLKKMPENTQDKLRRTLQKIVNDGNGSIICIIL